MGVGFWRREIKVGSHAGAMRKKQISRCKNGLWARSGRSEESHGQRARERSNVFRYQKMDGTKGVVLDALARYTDLIKQGARTVPFEGPKLFFFTPVHNGEDFEVGGRVPEFKGSKNCGVPERRYTNMPPWKLAVRPGIVFAKNLAWHME